MCSSALYLLSLASFISLFLSTTLAAPVNDATPGEGAKGVNGAWTTTTAILPRDSLYRRQNTTLIVAGRWTTTSAHAHYGRNFQMALDIPSTASTGCTVAGDGLSTAWCHCHLSQTGSVDTCVSKLTVLSSDKAAPPLPSILIIQWSALPATIGPTYGACAIVTGEQPGSINRTQTQVSCGGFQLLSPSGKAQTTAPADGQKIIEGIDGYNWTQEAIVNEFPGCVQTPKHCQLIRSGTNVPPTAPRRRSLNQRQDNTIVSEGSWTTTAPMDHYKSSKRFSAGLYILDSHQSAQQTSPKKKRDEIGNGNTLSLNAGWFTDAIKSHYNIQQLDLSLSVTYTSGTGALCSISGPGLSTHWCFCTADPSTPHLISSCAGEVGIASTDPSAPVMPNNMYIRWRPSGNNQAVVSALCGWRDHLGNWDANGQCKGFGMINPGHWLMGNVANWVENYLTEMRPDIALAYPMDEIMEEQRVKIDNCWKTSWTGGDCPKAVSTMPIQPPWSPSGRKREVLHGRMTRAEDAQPVARDDNNRNVLSLPAGWITDVAASHYNTASIPMTLTVNWHAGSGLQCNITGDGMSTLWCECTTDTFHQVSDCAGVANVTSTDPSAPTLPSAIYIRWYPRGGAIGIMQGMCGWPDDTGDEGSIGKDKKGACKGFKFLNWGGTPMANVASWSELYVRQMIDPRYALSWEIGGDTGRLQEDMTNCMMDKKKCPVHKAVMPVRDPTFVVQGAP